MAQADVEVVYGRHHVAVALVVGVHAYQMLEIAVFLVYCRAVRTGRVGQIVVVCAIRTVCLVVVELIQYAVRYSGGGQ